MALCSIAIAAGVVGVLALIKGLVLRRRFGGGGCGPGRGFGRFGGRHGGIGRSFWLRALYAKLDTTPGQEREIRAALEELKDRAVDARSALPETRANVARAIAGDEFDGSALEAVSARLDATGEMMKDAFASALKRIHAVLDAKQRERLAEIVGKGGFGRWGHGGGPYRDGAAL
jgi:Spy/CpxP family protein refolding chaperone